MPSFGGSAKEADPSGTGSEAKGDRGKGGFIARGQLEERQSGGGGKGRGRRVEGEAVAAIVNKESDRRRVRDGRVLGWK